MTAVRTPTPVDAIADRYLDAVAAHDPLLATYYGISGHDHELPGLDPESLAQRSELRRHTLAELAGAQPGDVQDRITAAALRSELETAEELRAAGREESDVNVIACPAQSIRDCFDLMPTGTEADWATIAARLATVPAAVDGYLASLRHAAAAGRVRARRQIETVAEQCLDNVGPDGFFAVFAGGAAASGAALPDSLRTDLARAAQAASESYARLAGVLRAELLPIAPEPDAVGRDVYALYSRAFLGTAVDLAEMYAWGQEELARITDQMAATAARIRSGATPREAMAHLDADPSRRLHGTDALQAWMQQTSDAAVAGLASEHFDIPEPIRALECRIAPTQQGGIYYTQPSEDLVTRPGRMWWSVPKGETEFTTWSQRTTVYHEGVPGHHLQIAQTVLRRDVLNRWRRIASWVSGHGEGWALYAERLMQELGYLDDPGDLLGMLDSQSLRAARVVLDIGVHCGFAAPDEIGGTWSYESAWAFLSSHVSSSEGTRRFELNRYLGWPGQAPSYKIGERNWLQLREEARARDGAAFDLKAFHRRALDIGSVGLDVLRSAVLGEFD